MFSAPHTATLRGRRQNFALLYDNGTAAFHIGATLTGATSHATAIIVSTGAQASGTLTLHTITGTFANDEPITDNNSTAPGAAVVNGVISEAFDVNGELVYTNVDTVISCRFYSQKDAVQQSGQAAYIMTAQRVMIAPDVTPANGDQLITTDTGHAGTYTIGNVTPANGMSGLHHWTCDIAKAGA